MGNFRCYSSRYCANFSSGTPALGLRDVIVASEIDRPPKVFAASAGSGVLKLLPLCHLRKFETKALRRGMHCGKRFHASQRNPPPHPGQGRTVSERPARDTRSTGPQVDTRSDPVRPTAKIVLEADSHDQMNAILLALSRAVSSYEQPVKQHAEARAR